MSNKLNYIVIHRTSRDRYDLARGIHRDHWGDSMICWCDPLVLYSDDKNFEGKVASGLPDTMVSGNDAVVIFPKGD